jgi:DNA mismatch repair protein MutL
MPLDPPTIHQLSDAVANQIAAGEVVERPAAVVKELVENSLDAGAKRVVVRSEDGGRRLIEVADDGHGMRPADLRLALARHATSKLRSADDLFQIATLGFRGEALPSIAAVSEFALASRPHGADGGWELTIVGGEVRGDGPAALSPGTRASVRNLFWNVPARLKFLKTESSETGHVTDQVIRLALSHPPVAFRLDADGRTVIDLPAGGTLAVRVRALFGAALADSLIEVAGNTPSMQLTGYISHPREARPTARRQYCFLNGRFVRDKLLLAALRDGYKGFLEPRLHAAVFLHLAIDPSLVDVNVHPAKAEVRFRREGEVFALISRTLQHALKENVGGFGLLNAQDSVRASVAAAPVAAPAPAAPLWQERFLPLNPAQVEPAPVARAGAGFSGDSAQDSAAGSTAVSPTAQLADDRRGAAGHGSGMAARPPFASGDSAAAAFPDAPATDRTLPGAEDVLSAAMLSVAATSAASSAETPHTAARAREASTGYEATQRPGAQPPADGLPRSVRRVVQLNRMFLLIETDTGLRLVDQHALHEKALFLCLDPAVTDLNVGGRQDLLIPRTVELSAAEVAALDGLLPTLAPHGIIAEVFGPTTVLVRAHPAALRRCDWGGFFASLAASRSGEKAIGGLQERIAHSASCHGAVKAGQILPPEEQIELVRLLYRLENMEHCPHGRPTTLDLTWDELSRRFQR